MKAVVLVGGEGTRLRPLTLTQPKPALPLVDRPFIRYMVDWVGRHGITEVIMACGFRAEDLRAALGDEVPGGPSIRYLQEEAPLGTAGPVRLAADRGMLGDRFMVLNGDVLADLDLTELQRRHEQSGATVTLGLYPVADPSSYGLVRRERSSGEVLGFLEKPDPEEIDTDEINAGAYVIERRALDLIPPGRAVSIEREVFPRLVGDGLFGLPARRLLDGHRHPRALPAGELGHPRGDGRDRARRRRRAVRGSGRRAGGRREDRAARGACGRARASARGR